MNNVAISVLSNGNILQANGLCRFTYIPTGKKYLIYTLNEKSLQNGKELNKVYVSETGDKNTEFVPITQDEWVILKSIMSDLGVQSADVPDKVQLTALQPTQYIVGTPKKIALNDDLMANLLSNQLAHEPKENTVLPTGNVAFFDKSVTQDQDVPVKDEPVIPNAFAMQTPVPQEAQEAAPTALVQQQPVQVQTVQQVQVNTTDKTKVVEALKVFLNYVGADMKKVDDILHLSEINTTPVVENKVEESAIDINNLPVVNQEPVAEENVLQEEAFIPSGAPTMPVDTMAPGVQIQPAPVAVEEPAPAVIEQPVVQPTEPVTPVAAPVAPTPVVQPVVQPVTQVVQPTPVVEQQVAQPVETVTQVVQPVTPVAEATPQVIEQPVAEQQLIQPVEPVQSEIVQPVQEAPVQQEIVQPTIAPVESAPQVEMPTTIEQPVAAAPVVQPTEPVQNELIQPITNEIQPVSEAPIATPTEQSVAPTTSDVPNIDLTSITVPTVETPSVEAPTDSQPAFLDAGPVVMPDGQDNVQSMGLPGDSGAKTLEKVA